MQIVTGAFGYIGKYITRRLLKAGVTVRTITTHLGKPNPFGPEVQAYPYNFHNPDALVKSIEGATVVYNTYWIRFEHQGHTFDQAVQNTRVLFECAKKAGVKKIVHISVTNADLNSKLPYYRGKALQEEALIDCDIPYAMIRPTLVFGKEDILVNNIAWLLRKFPVFAVFGSGEYRLQPVYVGDLADIAVESASDPDNSTIDAIGPEIYTFEQFVRTIASALKARTRLLHVPPALGIALGMMIGYGLGDVILTMDELHGLMDEKLTSSQAPNGSTGFSTWLEDHGDTLGTKYSSEIERHFY